MRISCSTRLLAREDAEAIVGGMAAKLNAAKTAMKLKIPFQIVDGKRANVIVNAVLGKDEGTIFHLKKK